MVKHQALQVYEKQVFLSIVTGIYGCRWKRYQRSQDNSSKWECTWFIILCSSFVLLLFWAYFWLVAQNDFNDFNCHFVVDLLLCLGLLGCCYQLTGLTLLYITGYLRTSLTRVVCFSVCSSGTFIVWFFFLKKKPLCLFCVCSFYLKCIFLKFIFHYI
uniref:Uncharacterized protein n=1 Tax=Kryptolebias marmoratus TaxID=37003 RepID=A0A3Q3AXW7_KRYMA